MVKITSIPNELIKVFGADDASTTIGTGSFNGQHYTQIGESGQGFRRSIWIWDNTAATWKCLPIAPIQGTATPSGSVTPDAIGQGFIDTTNGNHYIATGTTSSDWLLTN